MSLEAWLSVFQAGQHGAAAWQRALTATGSAAALATAPDHVLAACGLEPATIARLKAPDPALLDKYQQWCARPGHTLVTLEDERYPLLLAETPGAPLALWVAGSDPTLLGAPQLAIVGSRNATSGGTENAHAFAKYLSANGLVITSGLALGIDAAGHAGALAGGGDTLAVLGCGIDQIYPAAHAALARRITEQGLLVSEYPPGVPPRRHLFPARNRIIAGLSLGVLVVEAGRQSGSLITARLAGEYGREVFAVPGSIHNPMSRGCHQLIRQGAKLVEDAHDVLVELAALLELDERTTNARHNDAEDATKGRQTLAPEYAELLDAIGFDPTPIATIVERSTLTAAEVSSMLLLLELEGQVEALPGGRYLRRA
jgi:DNA processing protein